ncbi:uncharacterized protein B0I36DRAFT_383369 [Microdochium trichocladiopsis]|uniref:Uncharacterized protein n=1 Tax=Microdochium trichocladiopsis TaxID=1682393 RepID=A0A9P9BS62_9PEZI|nr:uncharacterized protein B0I36DRAFT_383369 [Microdochium trichocladiopsis]KAH7033520.1 hypothetical protein B0I36DRAFT_383369 [Microdochium trichocladiopsis]
MAHARKRQRLEEFDLDGLIVCELDNGLGDELNDDNFWMAGTMTSNVQGPRVGGYRITGQLDNRESSNMEALRGGSYSMTDIAINDNHHRQLAEPFAYVGTGSAGKADDGIVVASNQSVLPLVRSTRHANRLLGPDSERDDSATFAELARLSSQDSIAELKRAIEAKDEAIKDHRAAIDKLTAERNAMDKAMKDITKLEQEATKILESVGDVMDSSNEPQAANK